MFCNLILWRFLFSLRTSLFVYYVISMICTAGFVVTMTKSEFTSFAGEILDFRNNNGLTHINTIYFSLGFIIPLLAIVGIFMEEKRFIAPQILLNFFYLVASIGVVIVINMKLIPKYSQHDSGSFIIFSGLNYYALVLQASFYRKLNRKNANVYGSAAVVPNEENSGYDSTNSFNRYPTTSKSYIKYQDIYEPTHYSSSNILQPRYHNVQSWNSDRYQESPPPYPKF